MKMSRWGIVLAAILFIAGEAEAAKLTLKKDATSQTVYLWIQDSASTVGAGKTGLAYNTASLTCYYVRPLATSTAITLATQTVTGAYSSGGFVEVDATNTPGLYRLDLPNAAIATGVNGVVVECKGAANMAPAVAEIELVNYDPFDGVRLGLTALPNAAAGGSGGLPAWGATLETAEIADGAITDPKLSSALLKRIGFWGSVTVAGAPTATTTSFASTSFSSASSNAYLGMVVECSDGTYRKITEFDPTNDLVSIGKATPCPAAFSGTVLVWVSPSARGLR